MSRLSSKQLKQLQSSWEEKLKDSGFIDIEKTRDGERVLKQFANNIFQRAKSVYIMEQRLEYYLLISSLCHETMFGKFVDRFIMEQYAEGVTQAQILRNLKNAGLKKSRWKTHTVIKKYLTLWGLRGK